MKIRDAKKVEVAIYKKIGNMGLEYQNEIYEILGDLSLESKTLPEILSMIESRSYGLGSSSLDIHRLEDIGQSIEMKSSEYPCKNPKCLSKLTYSIQRQTRSADEGMSIFIECSVCNKRYKIS
jgi:DNA-directed RNA polymerase subunit M/transcription elongation factor TFIIS